MPLDGGACVFLVWVSAKLFHKMIYFLDLACNSVLWFSKKRIRWAACPLDKRSVKESTEFFWVLADCVGSAVCARSFFRYRESKKERTTMNMNILAVVAATGLASVATAEVLLEIDLTVANEITITATGGLSSATVSGSTFTGFYFENFYGGADSGGGVFGTLVSGDLTTASNPSDGSPSLFRAGSGTDTGLNVWSFSTDFDVSFTAGALAFAGSATWSLDASEYAFMMAGNNVGDIYFAADDASDLPSATVIGQWVVIPAPSSLALLGLGGIVAGRRRR